MTRFLIWAVVLVTASCTPRAVASPSDGDSRLTVPHFSADDPAVGTAGFVGRTTRLQREVDGTTYTLMAFAVGDNLTLGAMVEGTFDGVGHWYVGEEAFVAPLRRDNRGRTDVAIEGLAAPGEHGGFAEFDWVNVTLPLEQWGQDGTRVRLEFRGGPDPISIPATGDWLYISLSPQGT